MAFPSYASNDANTVQNWEKRLYSQVVYRSALSSLIGTDESSIIQLKKKTQKEAGDNVRYNLLTSLSGAGKTEGQTLEGNGETMGVYQDSVSINELLHAVTTAVKGRNINDQRVPFSERAQAKTLLSTWKAQRMGFTAFHHLCGYTPANVGRDDLGRNNYDAGDAAKYTGFNDVVAPSAGRQIFAGTSNASDEDLSAGDVFTLDMIDYAVEKSVMDTNPIRPIDIKGGGKDGRDLDEPKFVLYLSPRQVTQLRTASGSRWNEIKLAAMQGGDVSKNDLYTGALGEYNNVILRRAVEVTPGVNSSTGASISDVRRAVLMGSQSMALAYGQGSGGNSYNWNEETFDHNRWRETSMMCLFGMKKMRYTIDGTPVDNGVMVLSSHSPAST